MTDKKTQNKDSHGRYTKKMAEVYDGMIRKVVPGYDVLHDLSRLILQRELNDEADLLVVGAGTGHELVELSQIQQGWRVTGVEPAQSMCEAAQERIEKADIEDRAKIVCSFAHDLPSEPLYDAALLMLVMHFVADDGGKGNLLASIAERLKPGAPLVLADLNCDPASLRFERFSALWGDWQRHAGMPPEQVKKGFDTMIKEIHFIPEERTRELLSEAGFERIEPFYSALMFGGWIAYKS